MRLALVEGVLGEHADASIKALAAIDAISAGRCRVDVT
jgi:hypothetical protein